MRVPQNWMDRGQIQVLSLPCGFLMVKRGGRGFLGLYVELLDTVQTVSCVFSVPPPQYLYFLSDHVLPPAPSYHSLLTVFVCVCISPGEWSAEHEARRGSVPVQSSDPETTQPSESRQGHLRVRTTHTHPKHPQCSENSVMCCHGFIPT